LFLGLRGTAGWVVHLKYVAAVHEPGTTLLNQLSIYKMQNSSCNCVPLGNETRPNLQQLRPGIRDHRQSST